MRNQRKWNDEEINYLKNNYNELSYEELSKHFNRSIESIKGKAYLLGLLKKEKQPRFTNKEINILIENQGMTIKEVAKLLPNRSKSSVDYKIRDLGLNYNIRERKSIIDNIVKCTKCKTSKSFIEDNYYVNRKLLICKECLTKQIYIDKLKRKSGITLDFNKMLDTYSPEEWMEFYLDKKIKKYPRLYMNKDRFIVLLKYVICNKLGRIDRDIIITTKRKELKPFGLYGYMDQYFNCWYDAIHNAFLNLNIRPFELTESPKGYWTSKENANEYMIWLICKIIKDNDIKNIKQELPQYLSFTYLRGNKYNIAIDCLHLYKHYNSFYEWMCVLYPEYNFEAKDFSVFISKDGSTVLDSLEEKYVFDFITLNYPSVNIVAVGKKRKSNTYVNEQYGESYSPDFIVTDKDKIVGIIEYFGLYSPNNNHSIFKEYKNKADRKTMYFNNLKGIKYIDLYPEDLNNNFEGVSRKLTSFLYSLKLAS